MSDRRQRCYCGLLLASVLVASGLLAGCGSGASADPHARFISKAEQVCGGFAAHPARARA